MIKINLLPYHEKEKKENLARQISIIAGAFMIFALCLLWVHVSMTSKVRALEVTVADSRETLRVLTEKVGDVEKIKLIKTEYELKLGVIGTLEENRILPVKTLDDLSMLVPQNNIWLTRISQNDDNLIIEGVGKDNIAAADFMKTIEKFAPIKAVDLVLSKKVEISGITLQQFNFSCKMKKGF